MDINKIAVAGTLESCDVVVTVRPADSLIINLESTVKDLFGDAIINQVKKTLDEFGVTAASIDVHDRGAFDYTIAARVETAIRRASEEGVK